MISLTRGNLSQNRKRFLILSILLYVVIFQIGYNYYWKTPKQKSTVQNTWRFMDIFKQEDNYDILDIHIEDPLLGHTGETSSEYYEKKSRRHLHRTVGRNSVAIGCGITSKGVSGVNETNIASKFQLFYMFLPTFCKTASQGFDYHFFFSYDITDGIFLDTNFLWAFQKAFLNATSEMCRSGLSVSVHMVQCSHSGHPTWAQNDAMLEAYLDNMEYYYRINDDTEMITGNWTEMFIDVLRNYTPSNVGVVGPNHSGGNTDILTYDFVHRTHVDIFGFYYPRLFTDWWGDDWVTKVYRPNHSTKLPHVHLAHTLAMGQRYGVNWVVRSLLQGQLNKDIVILNRFINFTYERNSQKLDGKKVISMSLFWKNPKNSWGAIRNAQLAPILFPGWKLRFYITSRRSTAPDAKSWMVPIRILDKLKQLGAEIAYVKTKSIPPLYWRYLVIDDTSVDYFIVRNVHNRLSERDAIVVNEWLQSHSADRNAFHCIRDHPNHANISIVDGLWGGHRVTVRSKLGQDMVKLLDTFHGSQSKSLPTDGYADLLYRVVQSNRGDGLENSTFSVLRDIMWPLLSSVAYCHDSVSCDSWPNAHAFPMRRVKNEYLGQAFDEHQEPIANVYDKAIANAPLKCTNVTEEETTLTAAVTSTVKVSTTATVVETTVAATVTQAKST